MDVAKIAKLEVPKMGDNDLALDHLQAIRNLRIADEMSVGEVKRFTVAMAAELNCWRKKSENTRASGIDESDRTGGAESR